MWKYSCPRRVERALASGTRPGTQRKSREAHFWAPGSRLSLRSARTRPSRRQGHTFLRSHPDVDGLTDREIELGLGAHPDLAVAGIDQVVDHFAEEDPVRDLAGQHVEAVAGGLVVQNEILRPGADQHRLPGHNR